MSEQAAPKSPLVNIAVSIMAAITCCRSRDTITTNSVSNNGAINAPGNTISEAAPSGEPHGDTRDPLDQDVPIEA